jgi:hypothetical protein
VGAIPGRLNHRTISKIRNKINCVNDRVTLWMINTMWKIDSSSVTVWMLNGVQKIDSSIPGTIEIVREKTDVLIVYLLLNVERQIAFAYLPKKHINLMHKMCIYSVVLGFKHLKNCFDSLFQQSDIIIFIRSYFAQQDLFVNFEKDL